MSATPGLCTFVEHKMRRIISHIEYLLDHHECVIVPGIGAFIGHRVSAVIDAERNTITPPRRVITFNGELTHDDGLLASSYSRATGVSYTAALQLVQDDVKLLNTYLQQAGEVILGEIGTLEQHDGVTAFSPADTLYCNYGLTTIDSRYIAPQVEIDRENATAALTNPPRVYSKARRIMRYAAMIAILIGVGIVLSTPVEIDDRSVTRASMMPIETSGESYPAETEAPCELFIAEPNCDLKCSKWDSDVTEPEAAKYCLVIASLATREQAEVFIGQNSDDAQGMFESNGRFRVYGRTGATIADVADSTLQAKYEGAWPCRMP